MEKEGKKRKGALDDDIFELEEAIERLKEEIVVKDQELDEMRTELKGHR